MMPLDPQLLSQVLSTSASRDVTASPIVTAVILSDPANAADLVPALADQGSTYARNARRILCMFGAAAVGPMLVAARGTDPSTTAESVEIMWAMLAGEEPWTVRETLSANAGDLSRLLDDRRSLPDTMPDYIERDFEGRICDLTYVLLQYLANPAFDRSDFRGLDAQGRDDEIKRLKARDYGAQIV